MKKYNVVTLVMIVIFSINFSLIFSLYDNPWGTDLHKAVWSDKLDQVQRLVALGANINAQDSDGLTPLHRAVLHNAQDIANFLIISGAQLNIPDSGGWTPLHKAIAHNNIKMAQLLIQSGCSLRSRSKMGLTPLSLAVLDDRVEMVNLLIDAGALDAQDINNPRFKERMKSPLMQAVFDQLALKKQQDEQRSIEIYERQIKKDLVKN